MSVLPFKGRRLLPPSWIQGVWCLTFLICVLKNDYVQGKKSIPNISEIFPTTYLLWKSSLHQFCHPQNSVLHLNCFWNSCLLEMVPKKGNIAESHRLFLWIWKWFSMLTFCSKLFFQNVEVSRKFFHEFQSKQKYCCSKRVKKIAHEMLLETFNFSIPDTHFFWKNALAAQCKHWNSGVVCSKGKVWKHGFDFESHLNFQRIRTNTSTEGSKRAKIRFNGI